jgi:hypothetical protein
MTCFRMKQDVPYGSTKFGLLVRGFRAEVSLVVCSCLNCFFFFFVGHPSSGF